MGIGQDLSQSLCFITFQSDFERFQFLQLFFTPVTHTAVRLVFFCKPSPKIFRVREQKIAQNPALYKLIVGGTLSLFTYAGMWKERLNFSYFYILYNLFINYIIQQSKSNLSCLQICFLSFGNMY